MKNKFFEPFFRHGFLMLVVHLHADSNFLYFWHFVEIFPRHYIG